MSLKYEPSDPSSLQTGLTQVVVQSLHLLSPAPLVKTPLDVITGENAISRVQLATGVPRSQEKPTPLGSP